MVPVNSVLSPSECPAPVGLLTGVTGKRGPGRQSSLAYLQNHLLNFQHLCEESGDTNREVVRGLLPLELRGKGHMIIRSQLFFCRNRKVWLI